MKLLKKSIYCALGVLLLTGCQSKPIVKADYDVIPMPRSINKTVGNQFVMNRNVRIVYPKGNELLKRTGELLSDYLKLSVGYGLEVTDSDESNNVILLKTDLQSDNPESYKLTVIGGLIVIDGASEAGVFYGVQTLRKSIPADAMHNTVAFPVVEINDSPRFSYRGMHLDVSRHFFSVDFVKKYIDLLALHNINRFHWHLTDDQGWRIEIKKYPELTSIGSKRARTVIGRNSGTFDDMPYGGFYTQDEIRDVVEYARQRFITVIPEIDLPGHMEAALAAYPHLGCTGGPYKVVEEWGVFEEVLCAGNDSVYTFLEDVFAEVINLFPSEYIHVGGDECPKVRWKECPKCQAKIKSLGLTADAKHTKEDRLQSYIISYIERFLNAKGRQIIGWDEILEGGLAPNATVMSWRGMEGGIDAARQKHNVIMSPNSHLYFDAYQSRDTQDEPLAIGGYTPIDKVYGFEPIPMDLSSDERKYIIGLQANLWVEYIATEKHVEYMVLPRMAALSEVQWTVPEQKEYKGFLTRLEKQLRLYKHLGYNYATTVTDIASETVTDQDRGLITLSLFTYDNAPIYYTLDGSEPTVESIKYEGPIEIGKTTQIKALAVRGSERSKLYTNHFAFNKATLANITLSGEPHRTYTFKGAVTLVDGKRGSTSFGSGEWLGFVGKDMVATIDLREVSEISSVTVGTYLGAGSWIFGATGLRVELSDNGKTFRSVFSADYPLMEESTPNDTVHDLIARFSAQKTRYVRVTVKPTANIPTWHAGKGNPAFVFVDEIMIN